MPTRNFKLYALSQISRSSGFDVSGKITRQEDLLTITYELSGPLDKIDKIDKIIKIQIASPEITPVRKNRLWEETCFELFLAIKGSDPYWEFNFSPSGNWNVYRFYEYRKGMAEENSFSELPFCMTRKPDFLQIIIEIRLDKIIPSDQPLQAGISAIIKNNDDNISYLALTHPGPKPDFHLKDSFIMEL
jgi:hypothetical protein